MITSVTDFTCQEGRLSSVRLVVLTRRGSWHNVHAKFHVFPSSHSVAMKYVPMLVSCEGGRMGWVGMG